MKKMQIKCLKYLIIITVLLLITNYLISVNAEKLTQISSGNYGKGYRYNIQGWTYIHLDGDPYERGYQYAYLASTEIVDMIQRWGNFGHQVPFLKVFFINNQQRNYDKLTDIWWNLCRSKSMRYFEKHIPEEYKQELRGMVVGLKNREATIFGRNIEYNDLVASQFIQEVWYAFYDFSCIKKYHPIRNIIFGIRDFLVKGSEKKEQGHCRAIIATGDATDNGEIVAAHATIFNEYIAQRCNFIVDIKPTKGYRFIMTAPPGSLWSQEDFYQNEKGIILTETELVPQGPFNIRKTPKGIRSRTAIQYSKNIDEVIMNLQKENSGLIPNEWLIGDIKTNEIARLEQALFNSPLTRTKNGIFFSCSTPNNNKVERELWGLTPKILAINLYNNKYENKVIDKFNELKNEYYGKINIDIIKKMFSTNPISKSTTDCKITSKKLLENMGLMLYFGWMNGTEFKPSDNIKEKFKGITQMPSTGWLEIYDSNFKKIKIGTNNKFERIGNSKLLWKLNIHKDDFLSHSSNIIINEALINYNSTKRSAIIDLIYKDPIWNIDLEEDVKSLIENEKYIFLGTEKYFYKIRKKDSEILWRKTQGNINSKPLIYKDIVIASFSNGFLKGFDRKTGESVWSFSYPDKPFISQESKNIISVSSGKSCFGFDLEKLETIWEFKTGKLITVSPKINCNTVYVGSWDGNLYAIDLFTGELRWKYQTGWGIDSIPEISDGVVFLGGLDNNLYALNQKNGELIWSFTCNSAIHTNPIKYGDKVFFGCDDGCFYALNKSNGKLSWNFTPKYSIDNSPNNYITTPLLTTPVISDGVVYLNTDGVIYALDAQTFEKPPKSLDMKTDFATIIKIIIIFLIILLICNTLHNNIKKRKKSTN